MLTKVCFCKFTHTNSLLKHIIKFQFFFLDLILFFCLILFFHLIVLYFQKFTLNNFWVLSENVKHRDPFDRSARIERVVCTVTERRYNCMCNLFIILVMKRRSEKNHGGAQTVFGCETEGIVSKYSDGRFKARDVHIHTHVRRDGSIFDVR